MIYWVTLFCYAVAVRVIAAPGDLNNSRRLGYIDRAQEIEVYCAVATALHVVIIMPPVTAVVAVMTAIAIGLCSMEAVRLSDVSVLDAQLVVGYES
jgi:hypothetical protein